ncbi:MAG TPA: aldo/keto reductase [Polyangiaceae bacterium]|nr:aldo/keto reductase [Polyangiaceae bacterium]
MRYRRFGKTELEMPVLTCGGMRFQHSWSDLGLGEIPRDSQTNLEATIRRALELGMNHIETARGYGTSELQLGQVLPSFPRSELLVQTKVGLTAQTSEFVANFEQSLRNLRLERVELLSLHGINNRQKLDWALRKGGCLEAALRLKEQGLAKHVGFSTHATTDLILEAIESGGFEYVNLHFYWVNLLNWAAVQAAHRRDMGVFIISPNDKGGKLYTPPAKLVELCRPLTPMQFNDLYCLSHPEVHTLSIGAARPSDFDEHVAALEHYDRIEQTIAPIRARVEQEMWRVLGRDVCERYAEGIPEYVDVPGEVNVREIVRLWVYSKSLDLVDWGKMRYNLLGRGDDWFPGETAGKLDEPALRRVLANSYLKPDFVISALKEAHATLLDAPRKRLSQS